VKSKKPNPWGLYNRYGNVAEWCVDQYDSACYKQFPLDRTSLQPVKVPGPDRFPHVVRGGSWADEAAQCRSAARRGSDKSWLALDPQVPQSVWWLNDKDWVGFRVVRPYDEQDNLKGLRSKVTASSK
jgi:formylglycine-generating enzyme required for sulfatase activity